MKTFRHQALVREQRGVTMLEVLITIVIVAFGLLGIAGLQARMQVAEIEAYQRTQAIVLLQDMVSRINANRKNSSSYGGIAVGKDYNGGNAEDCSGKTGKDLDQCEWHNALLGATEIKSGDNVGAMIGARGCVTENVATMPREFTVAVVWQGLNPTQAPTSTTCGQNQYGNEATRRAIVARVKIGCVLNTTDPVTGLPTTNCVTP